MSRVYVKAIGLSSEKLSSLNSLSEKSIGMLPKAEIKIPGERTIDHYLFRSKKLVAKEDFSLLNSLSKLAIDSTVDAFRDFEQRFSNSINREATPVFSASDGIEINYDPYTMFMKQYVTNNTVNWDELGNIKEFINPLDVLRLLNTNTLYHLSKVFKLTGGGYPLSGMSLSGLLAFQSAFYHILNHSSEDALVCANANMELNENLATFLKLDAIKSSNNNDGIIPTYSSASLIIGRCNELNSPLAEIINIRSIYKNDAIITPVDWQQLYCDSYHLIDPKNLTVVLYDNGATQYRISEQHAISELFPDATLYSYKPIVGYSGKANNLTDLVLALADFRIQVGTYILLNGIGMGVGLGMILLKKLRNYL